MRFKDIVCALIRTYKKIDIRLVTSKSEQVWIQHSSQQGGLAIASYETDDPEQSFKVLATSNEPWAVKFREHLKKAHGIDIAQSSNMQLNELLANWKR